MSFHPKGRANASFPGPLWCGASNVAERPNSSLRKVGGSSLHEPKLHLRQFWPEATVHLNYRPDIDGLRAIAIVFVLMFHAAPAALPGGFIGVDIFFVISGYLITRMILVDLARRSFSFLAFYGRRIRRLFPALIIVIATIWLLGWFCFFPQQYASLGRHIVAGAGFASNLLSNAEVGYFDAPASTSRFCTCGLSV